MDYGWNVLDLINLKQEFITKEKESKNLIEKEKYETNLCLLDELILSILLKDSKLVDSGLSIDNLFNQLKNDHKGYKLKYISNQYSLKKKLIFNMASLDKMTYSPLTSKCNINDAVSILGEYIKNTYDDTHYECFRDLYIKQKCFLQIGADFGPAVTYTIDYLTKKEFYVLIPNTNNFKMFSWLSHETGHIYRLSNNPYYLDDDESLEEFESYFYEVKALLYCINNNIKVNDAKNTLKFLINEVEKYARLYNMLINNNILNYKDINDLNFIAKDYNLLDNFSFNNMEDLLDSINYLYLENAFRYIYSLICVLGILGDKKEKDIYNEIINNIGRIDITVHKDVFGKGINKLFNNYVNVRNKIKQL